MAVILNDSIMVNNTGYVPPIITEPDGSQWMQIFHHNNPANSLFTSTDTFATNAYISEDLWFNMSVCNYFTKWEMLVKEKDSKTATEVKYRWTQNYNPMTATYAQVAAANVTFVTGGTYTTPGATYGGFYRQTTSGCYLNASNGVNEANWYCALGAWIVYNGGIPGYNGATVTTGYLDVYIRIDNGGITGANLWALKKTYRTFGNQLNKAYALKEFAPFTLNSSTTSKNETLQVTSQGKPLFITISGDMNGPSYGWTRINLYRNNVRIRSIIVLSPGSSINMGYCLTYLDTVPAGTYTYKAEFVLGSGECQFGECGAINAPVFSIIEIS